MRERGGVYAEGFVEKRETPTEHPHRGWNATRSDTHRELTYSPPLKSGRVSGGRSNPCASLHPSGSARAAMPILARLSTWIPSEQGWISYKQNSKSKISKQQKHGQPHPSSGRSHAPNSQRIPHLAAGTSCKHKQACGPESQHAADYSQSCMGVSFYPVPRPLRLGARRRARLHSGSLIWPTPPQPAVSPSTAVSAVRPSPAPGTPRRTRGKSLRRAPARGRPA